MLQYLINVTDNTFIFAIVLALLLVVMNIIYRQGKQSKTKKCIVVGVVAGVVIGIVTAFIYAVLKRNTGYIVREYYDLALLSGWMVIITPTLITMWLSFFSQEKPIVKWLFSRLATLCLAIIFALFMPNIFLYPFEFDVGMESIFNTDYLFKCVGYCLAIVIVSIMGIFVYRISKRLSSGLILTITTIALVIFTTQGLVTIIQILIVRRFIAYQQWLMELVIFVLSHVNFFITLFMIISLSLALILYLKAKTTPLKGQNPAEVRKIKAQLRRDRRSSLVVLAGVVLTTYTVTRARYIFELGVEISPADPITTESNGLIIIPLEQINDGNLHRFGYETSDGTIVRFIIIKKSENAYGVGLDACDICGASGYYQRGDQIVCSLCDVVMNIATIGFPGGCNPVPFKFDIIDGSLVIKPKALEAEKHRFK